MEVYMFTLQYPKKSVLGGVLEWVTIPDEEFETAEQAHRRAVELQPRYPFPIVVVIPTGGRDVEMEGKDTS